MRKKILLVDDHPVILLALKIILEKNNFEIIAQTGNGIDALKLIKENKPDVVILDIGIPMLDGLEVIERVVKFSKSIPILVLSAQPAEYFVSRCLQSGASGFVSKSKDMIEVVNALKLVLSGGTYYPIQTVFYSNNQYECIEACLINNLSTKELIIMQQLAMGLSNKEISDKMLLSHKTISTYKTRIIEKLKLNTLVDIVEIAKRHHLV